MDNLNTIRTIQGLLNQAIVELRHLEFTLDAKHSFDVECIKSGIMAERRALLRLKNSEKSKQGTSPEPLVSDDTQLGTGCDSFASGAMKDEGLDAAPLGHKIHDGKFCPTCGKKEWRYEESVKVWNCKCVYF